MNEFKIVMSLFLTLAIGLMAGYAIRKNGEGQRLDYAYKGGFQACQEQF